MNSKNLSVWVLLVLLAIPLSSCTHAPKRGIVVTNCVSDPLIKGLHCVDKFGFELPVVPYEKTENYVCHKPEDDQLLNEAARGNSK